MINQQYINPIFLFVGKAHDSVPSECDAIVVGGLPTAAFIFLLQGAVSPHLRGFSLREPTDPLEDITSAEDALDDGLSTSSIL